MSFSLSEWVKSLSCVWLFATPWTIAYKAPLSMEFSRQEYWSGLPFPSPGDLPNPGIESGSPASQADALPLLEFLIDLVIFITRLWGPEGRIYIFHVLSILKTWEAQYSCLENLNGERSVVGYNPGGHKESDMTEQLSTHTYHKGIIKIVFRMNTSIFLFMWKLDIVMWTICQDARLVFEGMFRDRLTWDWVRQVGWY